MSSQLFKLIPKINILYDILRCFGLKELNDKKYFSRDDLIKMNSVNKLKLLKLDKYYLPCKAKIYLYNINEKKIITILRHFLRVFNYKLFSTEKYINKKKIIIYHIIEKKNIDYYPIILEDNKTIYF